MKKATILVTIALLVLAVGALAGCGGSNGGGDNSLVGRWESDVDTAWYVFNENGTGRRDVGNGVENFEWEVVSRNVVFSFDRHDEVWGFSIRRNTVSFTSDLIPGYYFPFSRAD